MDVSSSTTQIEPSCGALKWVMVSILAIGGLGAGCRADPATKATSTMLNALQYRDVTGVYAQHLESTGRSTYCASMPFHRLMDRVKKSKPDAKACTQAKSVTDAKSLDDELKLFFQVVRFLCQHPKGTCRDYGRLLFEQQLKQSELWRRPLSSYRIVRTVPQKEHTVVYVDLVFDAPKQTRHMSFHVKQVETRWVITNELSTWTSLRDR